jgi:mRNA interferase RelE/StbE
MSNYTLELTRSAEKELAALPKKILAKVAEQLDELEENPRPIGYIQLKGNDKYFRVRVGDYRIIYAIDDDAKIVDIRAIANRKDAYR